MVHYILHVMLKNDPDLKGMGGWTSKEKWSEVSQTKNGRKRLYNHIERAALVVDKLCKIKGPASLTKFVKAGRKKFIN